MHMRKRLYRRYEREEAEEDGERARELHLEWVGGGYLAKAIDRAVRQVCRRTSYTGMLP